MTFVQLIVSPEEGKAKMKFLQLTLSRCAFASFSAVAVWLHSVNIVYCSEQPGPSGISSPSDTPGRDSSPRRGASRARGTPLLFIRRRLPSPSPAAKLLVHRSLEHPSPREGYAAKKEALELALQEFGNPKILLSLYGTYKMLESAAAARGHEESVVSQSLRNSFLQGGLEQLLQALLLLEENPPAQPLPQPSPVGRVSAQLARLEQVITEGASGTESPGPSSSNEESDAMDSSGPGGQGQASVPEATPPAPNPGSPEYLRVARSRLRRGLKDYVDRRGRHGSWFGPYS